MTWQQIGGIFSVAFAAAALFLFVWGGVTAFTDSKPSVPDCALKVVFTPQKDMTTYELALILKHTQGTALYGGLKTGMCLTKADLLSPDWVIVQRHFTRILDT